MINRLTRIFLDLSLQKEINSLDWKKKKNMMMKGERWRCNVDIANRNVKVRKGNIESGV